MKKTITINLADLDQAKKDLEAYQKELDQKMKEAIEEMATKTKEQLENSYGEIPVRAGPIENLVVDKTINGNSATIFANGKNIAFIEFGTGIAMPSHTLQAQVEGVVGHGQYGKKKGANPKGWWFTSHDSNVGMFASSAIDPRTRKAKPNSYHTYGNPANMQVYNASKWLRQNYIDLIKDKLK